MRSPLAESRTTPSSVPGAAGGAARTTTGFASWIAGRRTGTTGRSGAAGTLTAADGCAACSSGGASTGLEVRNHHQPMETTRKTATSTARRRCMHAILACTFRTRKSRHGVLHGFQQALVVPNLDSAVFVPDTINGMNRWAQISVVVAGYGAAFAAAALDSRRMPEPLIGESVTDIDGTQAGELEIDASGIVARPGGEWNTALEIEGRGLSRLGVLVEGTLSGDNTESAAGGLRASLAFLLLHDEEHDFHLMIDATARLFENAVASELGEPTERIAFSLRGGIRRDWLTLRGSLGAGAGTHSAHAVPLRAEAA